jgi:nucleotide-binding universal stress UspA family protein
MPENGIKASNEQVHLKGLEITMELKTIVAVIRGQEDMERVVAVGAALVRDSEGHLIGVHAEPSPAAYVPAIGAEGIPYDETIIESNRERMKELADTFTTSCEAEGISFEWRGAETFMGDSAISSIASALAADLVLAQQIDPDKEDDPAVDLEALVFESGRPVLFVPYTWKPPMEFDKVVIAWNGSRESARAVFDALPFMKKAGKVEILCIDPQESDEHSALMVASEIAQTLDRHGIKTDVVNQISGGIPPSAAIQNRMSDTGANLLIMGAYSKSRIRETLFGGVTRTMLKSMTALTLMSR